MKTPSSTHCSLLGCVLATLVLLPVQARAAAGEASVAPAATPAQLDPPRRDTLPPPENGRCSAYAHRAVDDYATMRRSRKCSTPDSPRWQADYRNHYQWCLTVRPDWPMNETKARDAHLMRCGVRSSL